tara:strand:- start:950 stop:1411 length:462 start_codon:yes stop_codon:yes gene_type:complete
MPGASFLESVLRKTYRKCAHYAGGLGKGPDLAIMDDDVYTSFEGARINRVRVNVINNETGNTNSLEMELGVAKVFSSIDLDNASSGFAGSDAADGVTYLINTDYLEFPTLEAPTISEFQERVGDQDVVTALFSMQGNMICTKLAAQGAVTGGK